MASFSQYCKAYPIDELARFPGWTRKSTTERSAPADGDPSADDYVFVHDNFVVTEGIYVDRDIVFDAVTEDWIDFCRTRLGFTPEPHETAPVGAVSASSGSAR